MVNFYSNVVTRSRYNQKPMTPFDFERVEHELTQHISPSNLNNFVSKSLQNATGWSSGGVGELGLWARTCSNDLT